VVAGVKVPVLRFVGDYALAFDDGENLIGRMNMRPGSGAVVEEDGNYLQFLALLFRHQVMHVDRSLEVFGVPGSSDGFVGF